MPGISNYYSSRDRSNNNKRKSSVFVLEDNLSRTDDTPKYENCQSCYEVGIMSRLKERIILDSEGQLLPTPVDNENYLQCWECGRTVYQSER